MSKENLEVYYDDGEHEGKSKVYYIDPNRDRFLIVDYRGCFVWVNTNDCEIVEENNND